MIDEVETNILTPERPAIGNLCDSENSCDSANGAFTCEVTKQPTEPGAGLQLRQAPSENRARGRGSRKNVPNRSRSLCSKKVNKKDSMTQLALTNWSNLFTLRRSRSLDSRVNPMGDTAASPIPPILPSPILPLNPPPLAPSSPPSQEPEPNHEEADTYLQPWGDRPAMIEPGKVLRVLYQNVSNSMSTRGDDPGLPHLVENLVAAQCGVAICSETNVNWRRLQFTNEVRTQLQEVGTVHMSTTCSSMGDTNEFKHRRYLPGGAALFTFNHWGCTVVESGHDFFDCGWWCYTTLQGKNKVKLTLVGFYRSNKPVPGGGPTTAHAQAMQALESSKLKSNKELKRVVIPREEMNNHIGNKITEWQQRGDSILICGDGNETPTDCTLKEGFRRFSMSWLFQETGLIDLLRSHHSEPVTTTTTTPGRPIDWIGAWRVPILRIGRFKENFPAISDHLGFFLDIDIAGLFGGAYDELKLPKLRKLTVMNGPARRKYEEIVIGQFLENQIPERAAALHARAIAGTFDALDMVALNRLDTQITEILLGAENRCSNRVVDRDKWSPKLKFSGRIILYWRARLCLIKNTAAKNKKALERHRKRAKIASSTHNQVMSKQAVKEQLREAWRSHRACQQRAEEERLRHLTDRAEELAASQHTTQEKAVKAIRHREQTRGRFRRIRRANGKVKRGLIQIEVKNPTTGELEILTDKEKINDALLERNNNHLQEPNYTPFGMLGDLYNMVDPWNPDNQVEALLEGRATLPASRAHDVEVRQWVRNLQRKDMEEIDLSVSSSDFQQYFARRKENTQSSPSGRHYGHYKTIAKMESDVVRNTILQIAATAVAVKQPLDRWLRCTQVMLDKGKGIYINNLRIIQLLEADLNFIIGFIWSKRLNQAASRANLFNSSQYALPGKTCNSAVLTKVLFFDLLRATQQAGSIVDFDAKAAYDSIIPALATVTCMRMGLPKVAGDFMTELINQMEYSVATGLGESTKTYKAGANQFFKCQGGMQGSTSAAPIYNIHHDVSLTTYCEHGTPAIFHHPAPGVTATEDYAAQFVDDDQQQKSFLGLRKHYSAELEQCTSDDDIYQLLIRVTNKDANRWGKYSFCAGGLINASKCFWQFIKPHQCPNTGKISYKTALECPGEVVLRQPDDLDIMEQIPRHEPSVAKRTLGARLAPDGNVRAEIKSRYEKAKQWSTSLRRAQLSNADCWLAYNSCVRPAVAYPLVGQQCTAADLSKTQSIMDQIACHALGLNEHFPRALLHGPIALGGMGIPTLWAEALAEKISYFLHHRRVMDNVGKQLQVSTAITQLEVGSGTPFFQLAHEQWGHLATPSWVVHLWQSCSRTGIELEAANGLHWIPPLQTTTDSYIMDRIRLRYSRKVSIKLNHCRRYLQVVTMSDLLLHDGKRIHPDIYRGKRASGRISRYDWPEITPPSKACWITWKQFLRTEFDQQRICSAAADMWCDLPMYSHDLICRYNEANCILYRFDGIQWWCHRSKHAPHLRNVIGKFHLDSSQCDGDPPDLSSWVEIEYTKDAIVVLTESLRSAAAMRHLEDREDTSFLHEPVCLANRLRELPEDLRRLVGKVWLPEDNGQSLIDAIRVGGQVFGVSDGSSSHGAATHGWQLTKGPDDPGAIRGCGPVDGYLPTAFRAEMQGQLAVLIVSSLLVAARGIRKARIISLCDNKATLRRLTEHSRALKVRDHLESEVDLFLIYRDWMQKQHVQPVGTWVKGHQDRHKRIQDIDVEGQLNIEVDRLATLAYTSTEVGRTQPSSPVSHNEVYGVHINGSKVTSKLKHRIIAQCGDDQLRQYLQHKHNLSEGKVEGVNWSALQQYLNSLTPLRRASQIKLQHKWIPTKGFLFLQRRETCDQCPLCQKAVETASHVRQCQDTKAAQYRRERFSALVSSLRGINTAPEIVQCWRSHLASECGINIGEEDTGPIFAVSTLGKALSLARKHQSILSWEGLLHGRASIKWGAVQKEHEQRRRQETASHNRKAPWDVQIIRLISEFHSDLWQFRNDEVHGRTRQEELQKIRDAVEREVRQLYCRKPTLLPRYPSVQSMPIEARLRKSTIHLQMWMRQVAQQERITMLLRDKETMAGNSLRPYLIPRSEICRLRLEKNNETMQRCHMAASTIGRLVQRYLRHQSMVEMPFAGIGDPG